MDGTAAVARMNNTSAADSMTTDCPLPKSIVLITTVIVVCVTLPPNGWSEWGNGGKPSHKPTKRPTTQSSWGSSSWWGSEDVNHDWVWNGWSSNEWETTTSWKPASPTPAPTTNSQVGDDHFQLEGDFQVLIPPVLGLRYLDGAFVMSRLI